MRVARIRPQAPPARVLMVVPDTMDTEAFCALALSSGLDPESVYRARAPDDAEARQTAWAAKDIDSVIVKLLSTGLSAHQTEGNDHE